MKGKAKSSPHNAVEWVNGYVSNMPDYETARHCAVASEAISVLKGCRTVMLALDMKPHETPESWGRLREIDYSRFQAILNHAMDVLAMASGLEPAKKPLPPPPSMP